MASSPAAGTTTWPALATTAVLMLRGCLFVFLTALPPAAIMTPAAGHVVELDDMLMLDRFVRWQAAHNRTYGDAEERLRRFQVYRANIEYIEATNRRGGLTYELGENQFADLTSEEFLSMYASSYDAGDRADDEAALITTDVAGDGAWSDGDLEALPPPSWDWRAKGAVTPPKNQGPTCSSCWAFVTVATIEGLTFIKTGKLISLSEQQLVDCDMYDGGCNRGSYSRGFRWVLENGGLTTEAEYPYTAARGPCNRAKSAHHAAKITGQGRIPPQNELVMQKAVAGQPVGVAIEVGSGMQFYKTGVYSGPCGTNLAHAVTVVGYGVDPASGAKYWIVKNSWGQAWGERGFIRMRRDVGGPGLCGIALDVAYPY